MEIKTCEQYVISKLDFEEKKNEALTEENEALIAANKDLAEENNKLREILGKYLEKDAAGGYLSLFIPTDRYGDPSVADNYAYLLKYAKKTNENLTNDGLEVNE